MAENDPKLNEFSKHIAAYLAQIVPDRFNLKNGNAILLDKYIPYQGHDERLLKHISVFKHKNITFKTKISTVVFKASVSEKHSTYGFIYFNDTTPYYVTIGPTLLSNDGEYRKGLMEWNKFDTIAATYDPEIMDEVDSFIVDKLNSKELRFKTYYYFAKGVNTKVIKDFVENNRMDVKLYSITWLRDFWRFMNDFVEHHINYGYKHILVTKDGVKLYKSLIKVHTFEKLYKFYDFDFYEQKIESRSKRITNLICGQKLIPITSMELIRSQDITFDVWREIYITTLATNLMLNFISPSFPCIGEWFYVQNADSHLFDNEAMLTKYNYSSKADVIVKKLKDLDKDNYIERIVKLGPISDRFERLSRKVRRAIRYANENIKLSDVCLLLNQEHVGCTLHNFSNEVLMKSTANAPELEKYKYMLSKEKVFAKQIFEFLYGLFCLNTKLSIIHADLHANNATFYLFNINQSERAKGYTAYVIGDDTYMFAFTGIYSMIIDFSKCIMGDRKRIEVEFGGIIADKFFRDQNVFILKVIARYFPKLHNKFAKEIEDRVLTKFDLVFKILTGIDAIKIANNLMQIFQVDSNFTNSEIEYDRRIPTLCAEISEFAQNQMIKNMTELISKEINSVDDIEWPNLAIIKQFFAHHNVDLNQIKNKDENILDIFVYDNKLKYNINNHDQWGPLVSSDKKIELMKKLNIDIPVDYKMWLKYLTIDETDDVNDFIAKKTKNITEDEIEPWMYTY